MQPDLYYYGGLIRSRRVARMAEQADMATTVHLSGGFGFVYSLHFASCTPKIGPWQEYKEGRGNLRPMVRSAAANRGRRNHRAPRSGLGHRPTRKKLEKGGKPFVRSRSTFFPQSFGKHTATRFLQPTHPPIPRSDNIHSITNSHGFDCSGVPTVLVQIVPRLDLWT